MSVVFLGAGTGANRTISCRRPRCNCAPSDVNIPRTKSQDDNVGMIIFHYLTRLKAIGYFSKVDNHFGIGKILKLVSMLSYETYFGQLQAHPAAKHPDILYLCTF